MAVVTFDLEQCSVVISTFTLSGFASGDALSIEFPNDDFEAEVSSDGLITYVRKHNRAADVMFRLGQGNPLIPALRELHETSLTAGGISWPFKAINLKSLDEVVTGRLTFKKRPPLKWADSAQPVEFTASLAVDKFAGGSIVPT